MRGGRARFVYLVVHRIAEPDRERPNWAAELLRHEREYRGRVHPPAQKRTERHIRAEADPHGRRQLLPKAFDRLCF